MNLTDQEYKAAQEHINNWEKYASHWPKFRWVALCILFLCITLVVMEYKAVEKMKEYNIHTSILGNDVTPKDIGTYVDGRVDLLRAEMRYYIGFLISGVVASIFFVSVIFGWNSHKYLNAKVKIFSKLIAQNIIK